MTIPKNIASALTATEERKTLFKRLYSYLDGEDGSLSVETAMGWPPELKPRKGGYRRTRRGRKGHRKQRKSHRRHRKSRRHH